MPASIPSPRFRGTDTFIYTVSNGQCRMAVTVTVRVGNTAPMAIDDTASIDTMTPITVSVLTNDMDKDGDSLTVTSVTQPTHGTVTANNTTVTYIPASMPLPRFRGSDSFTYTVSDGQGGMATGTVTVTLR